MDEVAPAHQDQPAADPAAVVRLVACGSVDDGKSTLIGRLLADTGSVPDDQLDYARRTRRGGSTIPPGQIDYSLLTDGLDAEHQQGITIDVAYRHLRLPSGRRVIIADAPGHEHYTRNMAVAASTADLALLLVDSTRGLRAQTGRHLAVCALMGVRTVIAAVNKLDALGYRQDVYADLADGVHTAATRAGVEDLTTIPVSALTGDNVATAAPTMPWFTGPTVLSALSGWQPHRDRSAACGLRLLVQYVIRADGFRGCAGIVAAGVVRPGDTVMVAGRGLRLTVEQLRGPSGTVPHAGPGTPVTITFTIPSDVSRGDVLVTPEPPGRDSGFPRPATAFSADLVWTGEQPLTPARSYLLLAGPQTVTASITRVRDRLNVVSAERTPATTLTINDIGTVDLTTDVPVMLDRFDTNRATGGFLLVDRVSKDTVAAGTVRSTSGPGDIVPHTYTVDRAARSRLKGQHARVIWLTGLPGAGKSTIANALEHQLHTLGRHTYVLDGDNLRSGLNRDLGFTTNDRSENARRTTEVAHLMFDAGLIVIVALVSPFTADRAAARRAFPPGTFIEVWINTPIETCIARDPKGLYAQAQTGQLPNMTGIGQQYQPPESAELVLPGVGSLDDIVDRLTAAATEDIP